MIPYFLILAFPILGAIGRPPRLRRREPVLWAAFSSLLVFMIGFRWRVGADWGWIQFFFDKVTGQDLAAVLHVTDPGYAIMIWLFASTGLNVWTINVLGATMFTYGVARFCRHEPNPWLAATVAVPYLVVVVAMGYDRQAIAIGLVMNGLVALQQKSLTRFLAWTIAATTFHLSALLLVPIGVLGYRRLKRWQAAIVLGAGLGLAIYLLEAPARNLAESYAATGFDSTGSTVRVSIAAGAGVLFFMSRRKFSRNADELRIWTTMSTVAILIAPTLLVTPSSTVVDRIDLYVIPVEIFVFGRLPAVFGRRIAVYEILMLGVIICSAAELYIWLKWANSAFTWLPFHIFPTNQLTGHSI